jgi:hypothetical protein
MTTDAVGWIRRDARFVAARDFTMWQRYGSPILSAMPADA